MEITDKSIVQSVNFMEAILRQIEFELCRVMWNNNQEEYASPFANTGNNYKNDVFEVRAFDWSDEPEVEWNFKYKDIEISWYKHLGRNTNWNRVIKVEELQPMLEECLESINKEDKAYEHFS